jgi:hypothetical protein
LCAACLPASWGAGCAAHAQRWFLHHLHQQKHTVLKTMPDLLKPLLLYTTMLQAKGDYIVPTLTYYLGVSFNIASLALCWRYPRRKPEVGGQLWSAVGRPARALPLLLPQADPAFSCAPEARP